MPDYVADWVYPDEDTLMKVIKPIPYVDLTELMLHHDTNYYAVMEKENSAEHEFVTELIIDSEGHIIAPAGTKVKVSKLEEFTVDAVLCINCKNVMTFPKVKIKPMNNISSLNFHCGDCGARWSWGPYEDVLYVHNPGKPQQ